MPIASAFRYVLRWIVFSSTALASPLLWAQSTSSTAADGFDPNVNGNVYALVVQPDGKILIGGSFTQLQPNSSGPAVARTNLARVLANGQIDASFAPNVPGQVSAIALQPNGQIVVGGKFKSVVRLNANGAPDATFNPAIDGLTPEVTAIVVQPDQKIVVGGGFTTVQSTGSANAVTRNRIARFNANGTVDENFDPNANSMVLALALQADGKILVGGGFTTLQPAGTTAAVTRNRIARLNTDGSVDAAFNPDANNAVSAIAVLPDSRILIGGSFTLLQSTAATTKTVSRLARLEATGAVSDNFFGGADGQIYALHALPDGRIMIGGSFSAAGGATRSYLARLLPGGTLDFGFAATPNFNVYAIASQPDGSVVFGGGFTTVRGSGVNAVVRNHVARASRSGALDTDFHPDANGRLRALAVQADGKVLVGGSFTSVGGATHSGLVRLNSTGAVDSTFNVTVTGTVVSVVQQSNGDIVIGGSFSRVNGVARFNIARLKPDGSLDPDYDPAFNDVVNTLAVLPDGKILAGGPFTLVRSNPTSDAITRNNIARLNTDGTLDESYKLQTNGAVQSIVVHTDGKVLIGGAFSVISADNVNAVDRNAIARLNADGSVDTGFNPNVNGSISTILVQSDGKVVFGGQFTQLAPNGATTASPRFNIARVNADGSLDAAFDPSTNGVVMSLLQQSDGKILFGGFFTVLRPNGQPAASAVERRYLARVNVDGTVDTAFDLKIDEAPGNVVSSLVRVADNQVLAGGAFTSLNDGAVRRNRLVRLTATGAIDSSFDADLASAKGAAVESLTVDQDGRILAAGAFAAISGSQSVNLTRFNRDGFPDTTFTPTINGPVYATAELPTKGSSVATQRAGFAWLQPNGQLRSINFATEPSMTSVLKIVVQTDGKLLLGGISVGSNSSLLRFNSDGTADTAFAPAVNGTVYDIEVLSDNKILIGGEFTTVATQTRNNLARLNADGTLDTTYNPNAGGTVLAIELQGDGRAIVGGTFTSFQPNAGTTTARNRVARLNADGTVDAEFNPNANEAVRAIAIQSDGKVVVGGSFTAFQPNGATTGTNRPYLARLNSNGTLEEGFDLKVNGPVAALKMLPDNDILVGGFFSSLGGVVRNYLARVNGDGTIDSNFNPNPNDGVQTINVDADGKILIGGLFTALDPNSTVYNAATATPRNRSARLNADGTLDASFNPNFNSPVTTLVPAENGTILAGGTFNAIQPSGSLLVGGAFSTINGVTVNNLALFGRDGSVSSTFQPNPNGAVRALLPQINGQVIVAGSFTTISGTTRNHIARFKTDDTLDTAFDPNASGDVFAVALQSDGKLVVGGAFTTIGGAGRANLARLNSDGSNDSSFSPAVSGTVRAIAIQADGKILITHESGGANRLIRLAANGSLDSSFNPGTIGSVSSISVQADGHIIVGGSFTSIGGGNRTNLARLTPNGTLDATLTAQPNDSVTALAVQDDGKIVLGGTFSAIDGLPRFGLGRVAAPTPAADSFSSDAARTSVTWTRSGGAPEINGAVFEASNDGFIWTLLGEATRVGTTSSWRVSGLNLNSAVTFFVRARGIAPTTPGTSTGVVASQTQFYFGSAVEVPAGPIITSATAVSGASGTPFAYVIGASGVPTAFAATGLPAGLTLNSATGLITGTPTQEGTFDVVVTASNSLGSGSATIKLFIGAPGSIVDTGRVVNLSVLAPVSAGNPIIAGFVIKGSGTQSILLRAVGPGLTTVGVNNGVPTPNLKVYNAGGQVVHESNAWGGSTTLTGEFARLGAFPLTSTSADAAVILPLSPGPYTLHVNSSAGGTALAEVYDALPTPPPNNSPHLINISARGVVATAGQQVTGGFVITGTTPKQMLIRGIGPGLTGQGVTGAISNPVVTLNRINTGVIASNDNWETPQTVDAAYPASSGAQISAAMVATGAFSLAAGSSDAAILVTLAPGVYTAQVGGSGSATGAAMVEVYELP